MSVEQDLAAIRAKAQTLAARAAATGLALDMVSVSGQVHAAADQMISSIQAAYSPPACKVGCSYCCYGLIPVTVPELVELSQVLEGWSDSERQLLRVRLAAYAEKSKEYWRYDLHHFSEPCPLLFDGKCTVYENRPLYCRGKSSYDAEDCRKQMLGEQVPLKVVPGQHETGAYSVGGIVLGLKAANCYSGTYDLGASLGILVSHPGAAEELSKGETNPLNRVMMGSDSNVRLKPINSAAQRFLMPELGQCFAPGVDAERQYQAAIRLAPNNPYAVLAELVLPTFYDSQEELEDWWGRYQAALDKLPDLKVDPAVAFESVDLGALDTFGLAYTGKDVKPTMKRITELFHRYACRAHPMLTAPIEKPRKPGKFRLGYVSRRLIFNNGSRWALGWLTEQSPDIETYAFNLNESDDHISIRWRRNVDHYYHLPIPLVDAAKLIRRLDLDALIFPDVGTDGSAFQLSLLRTARYQMAAWGFPMTTGSPNMDFYLSSEEMEPPNGQDHYTEKLIRLPGSGQTFPKARRTGPSSKTAEELGLPSDGFMLIAQNPIKLLPHRDHVFREICDRTGTTIITCESNDGKLGARLEARLKLAKVNVRKIPFMAPEDFFRTMQLADAVLDTFDFSGGITTTDALTLKNPPVSCPGEFMRGRLGLPFMKQAGVADMIVPDERAYIELACDPGRIDAARERCDAEPIYRDLRPIRALDEFLLSLPTR